MLIDRSKILVVHGVTAEEWSKRWGIDIDDLEPIPCIVCGTIQEVNIPFVVGQLRGLKAPQCDCGHPTPPYCIVRDPKYGDLFG